MLRYLQRCSSFEIWGGPNVNIDDMKSRKLNLLSTSKQLVAIENKDLRGRENIRLHF
jgi:hypothetical protein